MEKGIYLQGILQNMVVPRNQIQDQSQRPWSDPASGQESWAHSSIPFHAHSNSNQPGRSAEAHSGPVWKGCEMNAATAILVTGMSSRFHRDDHNSFCLLWLPPDTCFRLRTIFLSNRSLKSFSLWCFFTGVIHFPHHDFWKHVMKKILHAICSNYSFPCLRKSILGEKNDEYRRSCENGHLRFLTGLC